MHYLRHKMCLHLQICTTKMKMPRSFVAGSVTSKKSPNVYKSCLKMISLERFKILTPKNVVDLGKLIVAKGFEKSPKVQ